MTIVFAFYYHKGEKFSPSALLMMRGLGALLANDGGAAVRAAYEWLPSADNLAAIAQDETMWDVWLHGIQHPSLLGTR